MTIRNSDRESVGIADIIFGALRFNRAAALAAIVAMCLVGTSPSLAMDLARAESRTDLAASTFGVSGQGVIVAILDRGIDWKNNDFRNPDGSTRIKYIFDLSDNTGANAPGNTYGRGTIYTETQINAALNGGPTLATRDAVGHGSTTAGIATGNGRNSLLGKYRGIAPNATIIVVKVTSDGAPAHGGEPAEPVFNDSTAYPVAIDFVKDKSVELNKPAVMLLNLGSTGGPTDGSSSLSRKIDATVGPGKPGLVFVTGPGDQGGKVNRAGGNVTQGGTSSIQIQKNVAGTMLFDLWYPGADRFDVSFQTPSGNFGPYSSPATNSASDFKTTAAFNYYHQGSNQVFYGSNNGKREIFVQLTGPVGTYTINLIGATASTGRFDATLNPSDFNTDNSFLTYGLPGSIWDAATAQYNICPGDYVIRTNWTDIDAIPRSLTGQGSIGQIWSGSSTGPTFDGRLGVDMVAPGDSVFTVYNPTSYFATFRFNMIQDGGAFYGRANAVSAAAPQVTGLIALMLEKNPRLDAAQVKSILQRSARQDAFTGTVPNTTWGYGKMDSYNAVAMAARRTPFDFDGDGKTDIGIFRPNGAVSEWWWLKSSTGGNAALQFGANTDTLVPTDYTGDGKTDVAFWRPSTGQWFILRSEDFSFYAFPFGTTGDVPVPADYDGDGNADAAVYRESSLTWYISKSSGGTDIVGFGAAGDKPVNADYDGDGKADIAIFRPNGANGAEWWIRRSSDASVFATQFGSSTDKAVPGDFTGDGKADVAFWRPSTGFWNVLRSEDSTYYAFPFGANGDTAVPGDYDGDGKTDAGVFRQPGAQWFVSKSTGGTLIQSFGIAGDAPIPNAFVR